MITPAARGMLERYALASRALSRESGERVASEPGQSVEFHDFRPYGPGDELRYVDWRVYARTGRLYTRLYQAERTVNVHLVLDTSASMTLGRKGEYARSLAALLSYVAQRDARSQVHLLDGSASRPGVGRAQIPMVWSFLEDAPALPADAPGPARSLRSFALANRFAAGAGLVLVISDLLDPESLQGALAALRARGMDAAFLHVMTDAELHPTEDHLELHDVETGERLSVGPDEVRAYRKAVGRFLDRTRGSIQRAGYRYTLLRIPAEDTDIERHALAELVRAGILAKR